MMITGKVGTVICYFISVLERAVFRYLLEIKLICMLIGTNFVCLNELSDNAGKRDDNGIITKSI